MIIISGLKERLKVAEDEQTRTAITRYHCQQEV